MGNSIYLVNSGNRLYSFHRLLQGSDRARTMSFGILAPLGEPHFVVGTFRDFASKVLDIDHRVEIAGIFKNGGRLLRPEEAPQHLMLNRPARSLRDVFQTENGAMVASQRLRDLVEELDPGCHQFLPIIIDNCSDGGTWFIFNVHAGQDSIVDEESDVEQRFESTGRELMSIPAFGYESLPARVTFRRSAMSSLNLWRERRYKGYLFCSDEFERQVGRRELKFFKFRAAVDI